MEVYKLSFLCVTMASDSAASEPDPCWTAELPKQVEIGLCMGAGCDDPFCFMTAQLSESLGGVLHRSLLPMCNESPYSLLSVRVGLADNPVQVPDDAILLAADKSTRARTLQAKKAMKAMKTKLRKAMKATCQAMKAMKAMEAQIKKRTFLPLKRFTKAMKAMKAKKAAKRG